jgi:hypothetical protein
MRRTDRSCDSCGRGKLLSTAVFHLGEHPVRWSMWTCGHTRRQVELGDEVVVAGLLRDDPPAVAASGL